MGDTQSTHLSEQEYRAEVTESGGTLAQIALDNYEQGMFDSYEQAVLELAGEVLFPHEWFEKYGADPADLGAIIGHGDADVEGYGDHPHPGAADTLGELLRYMAQAQFEADCIADALNKEG